MSFLEILTRTIPDRPVYLKRNQDSLRALRDPDWSQQIILDAQLHGVAWANKNLGTVEATGDWVWVLDDDDVCAYADLITDLRATVKRDDPEVVFVRVFHSKWGMLPPEELWGRRPILGRIGGACVIVRRDVWQQYRTGWSETYAGDFWYINGLWEGCRRFAWLPVTACWQTQQSNGAGDAR